MIRKKKTKLFKNQLQQTGFVFFYIKAYIVFTQWFVDTIDQFKLLNRIENRKEICLTIPLYQISLLLIQAIIHFTTEEILLQNVSTMGKKWCGHLQHKMTLRQTTAFFESNVYRCTYADLCKSQYIKLRHCYSVQMTCCWLQSSVNICLSD